MKLFDVSLEGGDVKPVKMRVTTRLYLPGVELREVVCRERELQADDVIEFDELFGQVLGVTYADAVHGRFECLVKECDVPCGSRVLILVDVTVGGGDRFKLFVAGEYSCPGRLEMEYVDRLMGLDRVELRLKRLSELLSVPEDRLKTLLQTI